MTTAMTRTELQAWLDTCWSTPDARTLADFLGIELAEPEPETPVGQRRRSPGGVEVVKTDGVSALCWQRYAGVGKVWFSYDAIADWQIVTDAPEVPEDVLNAAAQRISADVCHGMTTATTRTEPAPVGQRRRSPDGVEVIKTDDGTNSWRRYRGKAYLSWFSYDAIADWEVITDAPEVPEDVIAAVTCLITETGESLQGSRGIARRMADAGLLVGTTPEAPKCDLEHLPSHSVRICLATISDDFLADLARGAGSPIGPVADAAHRERERRRLHDATTEEETA